MTRYDDLTQNGCHDLGSPENFFTENFANLGLMAAGDGVVIGLLIDTVSGLLEGVVAALMFTGFRALSILTHARITI